MENNLYICYTQTKLLAICDSREMLAKMVLHYMACGYPVKTKDLCINTPYKNAFENNETLNFKLN